MKKIFLLLALAGCCSSTGTSIILQEYGEECLAKPYTISRDTQTLCAFSAIAKHNSQVRNYNETNSNRLK